MNYLLAFKKDLLLVENGRLLKTRKSINIFQSKYQFKILKKVIVGKDIIYIASKATGDFIDILDINPTLKEQYVILQGLTAVFKMPKNKIFFSGTFNPWHQGHMECMNSCSKITSKKIIVIPDYSPWKSRPTKIWDRFIRIYSSLKDSSYLIYPGLLVSKTPSPTYQWLKEVSGDKNLLMGDDNFVNIKKWSSATKLLRIINNIYVISRNSEVKVAYIIKSLRKYKQLKVTILGRHRYAYLSSTAIRRGLWPDMANLKI